MEKIDGTHTRLVKKIDGACNRLMGINRRYSHQVGRKNRRHLHQVDNIIKKTDGTHTRLAEKYRWHLQHVDGNKQKVLAPSWQTKTDGIYTRLTIWEKSRWHSHQVGRKIQMARATG